MKTYLTTSMMPQTLLHSNLLSLIRFLYLNLLLYPFNQASRWMTTFLQQFRKRALLPPLHAPKNARLEHRSESKLARLSFVLVIFMSSYWLHF
ncbi:hypothetical protein DAI22_03g265650 [Oryza sativa Japonica Group]|nr:hypothetical protein DAI22_03g265650 [Oryza sativa Japonica Group]